MFYKQRTRKAQWCNSVQLQRPENQGKQMFEGSLQVQELSSFRNTLKDKPRNNVLPDIWAFFRLVKLTHKIKESHHKQYLYIILLSDLQCITVRGRLYTCTHIQIHTHICIQFNKAREENRIRTSLLVSPNRLMHLNSDYTRLLTSIQERPSNIM